MDIVELAKRMEERKRKGGMLMPSTIEGDRADRKALTPWIEDLPASKKPAKGSSGKSAKKSNSGESKKSKPAAKEDDSAVKDALRSARQSDALDKLKNVPGGSFVYGNDQAKPGENSIEERQAKALDKLQGGLTPEEDAKIRADLKAMPGDAKNAVDSRLAARRGLLGEFDLGKHFAFGAPPTPFDGESPSDRLKENIRRPGWDEVKKIIEDADKPPEDDIDWRAALIPILGSLGGALVGGLDGAAGGAAGGHKGVEYYLNQKDKEKTSKREKGLKMAELRVKMADQEADDAIKAEDMLLRQAAIEMQLYGKVQDATAEQLRIRYNWEGKLLDDKTKRAEGEANRDLKESEGAASRSFQSEQAELQRQYRELQQEKQLAWEREREEIRTDLNKTKQDLAEWIARNPKPVSPEDAANKAADTDLKKAQAEKARKGGKGGKGGSGGAMSKVGVPGFDIADPLRPPSAKDSEAVKSVQIGGQKIIDALSDLKAITSELAAEGAIFGKAKLLKPGTEKTRFLQALNSANMGIKEYNQLGALVGGDFVIIERTIPNLAGVGDASTLGFDDYLMLLNQTEMDLRRGVETVGIGRGYRRVSDPFANRKTQGSGATAPSPSGGFTKGSSVAPGSGPAMTRERKIELLEEARAKRNGGKK